MRTKKQINIEIGEQIKHARETARMTQEQLAEHVEVSPQYISDLERGVVGISIATLKRVCTTLKVSSDQILFGLHGHQSDYLFQDLFHKLSREQQRLLAEIAARYVDAVLLERECRT